MDRVTLVADARLVEAVRCRAIEEKTSLNELFSRWMVDYLGGKEEAERAIETTPEMRRRQAERAVAAIDELRKHIKTGGRKFTRDEMNER